jgi:uncharacterized protein YqgC (DUF456 family)
MEVLALVIVAIFSLIGLAAIFFTTFGTLIILIGAVLYAFLTNFAILTVKTLIILLVLYLFGEALEYIFIITGAKKFGASNKAIIGALIGGIIGAIIGTAFFGVGLIVGTFLGIFLGAFLVELIAKKDVVKSIKAGTGGVLGRIGSIAAKIIIAAVMLFIMFQRIIIYTDFTFN